MSSEKELMVSASLLMIAEKKLLEAAGGIERLKKENEMLRKCVEFYADIDNFGEIHCGSPNGNDKGFYIYEDEGKLARQTLKELGEVESER